MLLGCFYEPPGHSVSSAEEFFSSMNSSTVYVYAVILTVRILVGVSTFVWSGTSVNSNKFNFIEKLEYLFISPVIDFGTFSSGIPF